MVSRDASNAGEISERPAAYSTGWIAGEPADYDRGNCVDLKQLSAFLIATQPNVATALALDSDNPTRRQFLARLKREVRNRGVIDVLRKGVNHQQHHVDVFYGTPTPGNTDAEARYAQNRFSVTRQLRYSNDERQRALDLALFVNGLPISTLELKNGLTKQTVDEAVNQYRNTRSATRRPVPRWHGAPPTSRWTNRKCGSAPSSPAKPPFSCRSTGATTMVAPAIPSTRTGSRRTISGETC